MITSWFMAQNVDTAMHAGHFWAWEISINASEKIKNVMQGTWRSLAFNIFFDAFKTKKKEWLTLSLRKMLNCGQRYVINICIFASGNIFYMTLRRHTFMSVDQLAGAFFLFQMPVCMSVYLLQVMYKEDLWARWHTQ